jgi:hypothetical protein
MHDALTAVNKEERYRVRDLAPLVHKVDVQRTEPVDGDYGRELRHGRVDGRLLRAPVVPITPVLGEPLDVGKRRAVLPRRVVQLVREAGEREALLQVVQLLVRHMNREWLCCSHGKRRGGDTVRVGGAAGQLPELASTGSAMVWNKRLIRPGFVFLLPSLTLYHLGATGRYTHRFELRGN